MVRNRRRKNPPRSALELRIEDFLKSRSIPFEVQKPISRITADFFLPATNTILEVMGCYWHACRDCFPGPKQVHAGQRKKDSSRLILYHRFGYKILVLWEHEINSDWPSVERKLLESGLG